MNPTENNSPTNPTSSTEPATQKTPAPMGYAPSNDYAATAISTVPDVDTLPATNDEISTEANTPFVPDIEPKSYKKRIIIISTILVLCLCVLAGVVYMRFASA